MKDIFVHYLMWREYMALLPLACGLLLPGMISLTLAADGRIAKTPHILGTLALLLPFYIGMTGIATAMDIGDIGDKRFVVTLIFAVVELAIGCWLAFVMYINPLARALDAEARYSKSLEHTVGGYQAQTHE